MTSQRVILWLDNKHVISYEGMAVQHVQLPQAIFFFFSRRNCLDPIQYHMTATPCQEQFKLAGISLQLLLSSRGISRQQTELDGHNLFIREPGFLKRKWHSLHSPSGRYFFDLDYRGKDETEVSLFLSRFNYTSISPIAKVCPQILPNNLKSCRNCYFPFHFF